jgi:Domain of unknown function (DUF4398)
MSNTPSIRVVIASATLVALIGCATSPRSMPDLAASHALIAQAEQSDAPQYASADLESARHKVQQADEDAREGKTVPAMRLASEASVDAQVAMARTRAIKSEQALHDVNAGTRTLSNESLRNDVQQTAPSGPTVIVVPDTPTQR